MPIRNRDFEEDSENKESLESEAPIDYVCSGCRAIGCKLWREPNKRGEPRLLCCNCAAKEEGADISSLDSQGTMVDELGESTNHIGRFVPAVPLEYGRGEGIEPLDDGQLFWQVVMPTEAYVWWRDLLTKP